VREGRLDIARQPATRKPIRTSVKQRWMLVAHRLPEWASRRKATAERLAQWIRRHTLDRDQPPVAAIGIETRPRIQ
jgi:hypothetical protein